MTRNMSFINRILDSKYFKEALQDYNSYALPIPFSEIKSKLDRDRQIDANFKNALQNYQGVAHDKEFALIRNRVLQIQNKDKEEK